MDKNQEAVLNLLKEIDDICAMNGIVYYLHADSVAIALKKSKYVGNSFGIGVEMTADNALRFIEVVESSPFPNRAIEHLGNSACIPGINFRYVDTSTLYLPLNWYGNHKYKGIAINVFIVRKVLSNKIKRFIFRCFEVGLEDNAFYCGRSLSWKRKACKKTVAIIERIVGEERYRRAFFKRAMRILSYDGSGPACVRKQFSRQKKYPEAYLSDERSYVLLEDHIFRTYPNARAYVQKWYGKNWEKRRLGVRPGRYHLIDSRVAFKDLKSYVEDNGISLDEVASLHAQTRDAIMKRKEYNDLKTKLMQIAKNVKSNYGVEDWYRENEERIASLGESFAVMELNSQLARYRGLGPANKKYNNKRIFPFKRIEEYDIKVKSLNSGEVIAWDDSYLKQPESPEGDHFPETKAIGHE